MYNEVEEALYLDGYLSVMSLHKPSFIDIRESIDWNELTLPILKQYSDDTAICFETFRMLYNYVGRHRKFKDKLFSKSKWSDENTCLKPNRTGEPKRYVSRCKFHIINSYMSYNMMHHTIRVILDHLNRLNKVVIHLFVEMAKTYINEQLNIQSIVETKIPRRGDKQTIQICELMKTYEDKILSSVDSSVSRVFDDMEPLILELIDKFPDYRMDRVS